MRAGARTVTIGFALALLSASVLAANAAAAFPGGNGSIAFTTYYLDGNENVYAIEPGGTGLRRLTDDPAQDDDAAWSPNGRRVAFASNRAHPERSCEGLNPHCDYDIYVMNAEGSNVVRLTGSPASDRDPAWSPDGRRIVFSSTRADEGGSGEFHNSELYTMEADGSAVTRITVHPGVDHQAAWSPDGAAIVFRRAACEFNCLASLFSIAPDGSGLTELATGSGIAKPNWAPDASRIVFVRDVGASHFFTMNPDGSDQTIIPGQHGDPAWSPDGTRIAFGYPGIGHMNVDGSDARTVNTSGGEKPDWQPRVGPRREDFKTRPEFCRAEQVFLGEREFAAVYRTFGGCVSGR